MRAGVGSLTHRGMRAWSAPAVPVQGPPVGPRDGTDDEPAAGSDRGDRCAVRAGEPGREGHDPRRAVRDHGLASQPCAQGAEAGAAAEGGASPAAAGRRPRGGRHCRAAVLLGGGRRADGKRLAPVMGGLVAALRRCGELDVSDEVAAALVVMSPATTDRRLAADRAAMTLRGRSRTKPGSLLKDAIPIRTWAQWD